MVSKYVFFGVYYKNLNEDITLPLRLLSARVRSLVKICTVVTLLTEIKELNNIIILKIDSCSVAESLVNYSLGDVGEGKFHVLSRLGTRLHERNVVFLPHRTFLTNRSNKLQHRGVSHTFF